MAEVHIYEVIRRPIVTEKSSMLSDTERQYVFEVDVRANKIQIREAVEVIFDKDVQNVRTMIVPAKRGRRGRRWYRRKSAWKKAIVTLAEDQEIDLFNL